MQQGAHKGSQVHKYPGHTTLSLQIGTRAWSGEWSDAANSATTAGVLSVGTPSSAIDWGNASAYLRAGSNDSGSLKDSQSCLQPDVRVVPSDKLNKLLDALCEETPTNCMPTGCCAPKNDFANSSCYGADEATCMNCSTVGCTAACARDSKHKDWCCQWYDYAKKQGSEIPDPTKCTTPGGETNDCAKCQQTGPGPDPTPGDECGPGSTSSGGNPCASGPSFAKGACCCNYGLTPVSDSDAAKGCS